MNKIETIFLSEKKEHVLNAVNHRACSFLLKPYHPREFIIAVNNAKECIRKKKNAMDNQQLIYQLSQQLPPNNRIGIPTIEGFEVFQIDEIIRCEGLQNCTRIVTKDKADIVSSYNIGKFAKMLDCFPFYAPHKSHLVNLSHVRKYYHEGTIIMSDNSHVPVAKRRKGQFVQLMLHSR